MGGDVRAKLSLSIDFGLQFGGMINRGLKEEEEDRLGRALGREGLGLVERVNSEQNFWADLSAGLHWSGSSASGLMFLLRPFSGLTIL